MPNFGWEAMPERALAPPLPTPPPTVGGQKRRGGVGRGGCRAPFSGKTSIDFFFFFLPPRPKAEVLFRLCNQIEMDRHTYTNYQYHIHSQHTHIHEVLCPLSVIRFVTTNHNEPIRIDQSKTDFGL